MSYLTIATHAGAALVAGVLTTMFLDARHTAEVGEILLAQADAQLEAVGKARARERANNARTMKALNNAQHQNAKTARELSVARTTSDGLREQLREADDRVGRASAAAVAEYAVAANAVLGECQREYLEVAGKAQGHANDVRTHRDGWPVNP